MPVKRSLDKDEEKEEELVGEENGDLEDVLDGELKNRRYGVRIDDEVVITVIAGNDIMSIKGRLLSMKEEIELVGDDGCYIQIMADWVVAIKVLKHNRPLPEKDKELVRKPIRTKPKKASVDHAYN